MQKKIFTRMMGLALMVALLMVALTAGVLYASFESQLNTQLQQEASLLASLLEQTPDHADAAQLQTMSFPNRVTLINEAGVVLYDNQSAAGRMENHGDREEIVKAAATGEGFAKRHSDTLFEEQLYYALHMKDSNYLRISISQKTLAGLMGQMLGWIVMGLLLITLVAVLLSRLLTRRLMAPINALNFDDPLSNEIYDEFSPMLRRMAEQNQKLDVQMKALSSKQAELSALISNMREGLVIMDGKRRVLTMNKSAGAVLQTSRVADGKATLMELSRNEDLRKIVEAAGETGSVHREIIVSGREYTVNASVIGRGEGMVLLFQDCADGKEAERARKRFTANVSHELRTPLTAISGYAEMMNNGMAKPEDVPAFANKIHQESKRLLCLIEDILRLSRLDEGNQHGLWEPVGLLAISQSARESLRELGGAKGVTVTVEGEDCLVKGDPALLEEMVRNLMENGIKYNAEGGAVRVKIAEENGRPVVRVEDNGIGIPAVHQSKVFERFYRVDSSRSKATGGTGLGLSIVKHGAEYHHATASLQSEPGKGTTVSLSFPKSEE